MSRIGKAPITIPAEVEVAISGSTISVKGARGSLEHTVPEGITVALEDGVLTVGRVNDERPTKALHGLSRSLVNNMVVGVSQGFRKDLEIVGVGYRANSTSPDTLNLALGFSHPVEVKAPDGITFEVPEPTKIGVIGIDKQAVGQVAAVIRSYRKPEPYKGKGIRYAGERVLRKAGKSGK
ncbi:MAG: 50S ribosomal protein L6 [Actinomycetota bacterium]|nr:50S ribosomal protein L6 [Actinomycetota bacterium]